MRLSFLFYDDIDDVLYSWDDGDGRDHDVVVGWLYRRSKTALPVDTQDDNFYDWNIASWPLALSEQPTLIRAAVMMPSLVSYDGVMDVYVE